MQTTNEIRSTFLEFFGRHGHEIVPSSPLVPLNDPSLLFTNAGMVQFKNVFTGVEQRPYCRATTSQKCVRAGGKHNDLDNVGYTARHLTFFEMLGNFSFGDYFKPLAIELAWNLVTEGFGLAKDRLLVTVYAEDEDAFELWRKIAGLPEERIIKIPTSDNFWSMGDVGPCGPCSEIFYDHGPEVAGGPPGSPDEDGDRFIEIWNLVFMQFEQFPGGERQPLPKPSIDTGMGLERFAAVMQGVHEVYEIDLFQRLITASVELTGVPATGATAASHKVIADHLRSSAFLIADGVTPSNDGRGYVLRRIMRRAMRHAHLLGAKDPLLWRLVPELVGEMGAAFPELPRAQANIEEWLKLEEVNFRKTLERGLGLLEDELDRLAPDTALPGETAFKLYDTYGFPLDLTQDALRAQNRTVDIAGFEASMKRQKEAARKSWKGSGEGGIDPIWYDIRDSHGATEFLGYETERAEAEILAIVVDGQSLERAAPGQAIELITSQTPFYGESGGQIGDTGTIEGSDFKLEVTDTKKILGDLWLHTCQVVSGTPKPGEAVLLQVDSARRRQIRRAHSATHLLHKALRRHLGDHVAQRGSLVAPDRLRFDFSHPKPIEGQQLLDIEREVNELARQNAEVSIRYMERDAAIDSGAMALFGEKYGDEVRVVSMGKSSDNSTYSVELCGGTHVARTGDIALVNLVGESAVAAGIRRIEALTGEAALAEFRHSEQILDQAAGVLKVQGKDLPARITALIDDRRRVERELVELRQKIASGDIGNGQATKNYGSITFAGRALQGVPAKELRGTADTIKKDFESGVVALVSEFDGKAAIVVSVTDDLTDRLNAVELVKQGVGILGGKGGGGRADFAQGGGSDPSRAADAIDAVEQLVKQAATN